MKGADKTGRSKGNSRFVQLHHYILECEAWRALSPADRCVYLAMAQLYTGTNNGSIALGVRRAAELASVNKNTAEKSLQALQDHGFIERVVQGGFSRKTPHATEWRLTAFACNKTKLPGTKAFLRWSPQMQNAVPATRTALSQLVGQLARDMAVTVPATRTVGGR